MGFAQTVDSFVKLLDAAPKPPVAPTKKLHKAFSKTYKASVSTKDGVKTHEFKLPAHVTKLAALGTPSAADSKAFIEARVAHISEVTKAFAALPAADKKRLSVLAHATDAKSLKASGTRGLVGATADSLRKGLALAKAQKINLESATW